MHKITINNKIVLKINTNLHNLYFVVVFFGWAKGVGEVSNTEVYLVIKQLCRSLQESNDDYTVQTWYTKYNYYENNYGHDVELKIKQSWALTMEKLSGNQYRQSTTNDRQWRADNLELTTTTDSDNWQSTVNTCDNPHIATNNKTPLPTEKIKTNEQQTTNRRYKT